MYDNNNDNAAIRIRTTNSGKWQYTVDIIANNKTIENLYLLHYILVVIMDTLIHSGIRLRQQKMECSTTISPKSENDANKRYRHDILLKSDSML